jgi:hypothetical protein
VSSAITGSLASNSVTTLSGAARPGRNRSAITCCPWTESGGSRNASVKSSGSRPPRFPSAPAISTSVTIAAVGAGWRPTCRLTRRHSAGSGPGSTRGTAGQNALRPSAARIAGSSVSPATTMTATPSARIGPISRVALKSASASTSIVATTIVPADRIAGPVRSVARAIASPTSSVRRSSSRKRATISRQ